MRLTKIGDILLATYGIVTAVDKLDTLIKDEQEYKRNKELKRHIKKGYVPNDYQWLMFDSKDAAIRFLDRLRDNIDEFGSVSFADIYWMKDGSLSNAFEYTIGYKVLYDSDVKIRKFKGRWRLILPRPVHIL